MAFLSKILPTWDYHYFDQYHQLQTKQLNYPQWFFRKWLNWYPETHLANVVKKAYSVTLNDEFQGNNKARQILLKLFAKAEKSLNKSQGRFQFPEYQMPSGLKAHISMHYGITTANESTLKVSSIYFDIECDMKSYSVSFIKSKFGNLVVHLPREIFRGYIDDSKKSIESYLSDEKATTINALLAKILTDSSPAHEIAEVRHYATDYRWMPRPIDSWSKLDDPNDLNQTQEKMMEKLGWTYFNQFAKQGNMTTVDVKRVYLLRKEDDTKNQTMANLKQKISLAFAIQSLETRSQEF